MKTKTLLATIAVAGLTVAQPLAAATRSAESLPVSGVQAAQPVERVGAVNAESEELVGAMPLILILGMFLAVAAIVLASSGNKSPG